MGALESIYRQSLEDPGTFWREAATALDWERDPARILDDSRPPFYRWFADGVLNTCHNALDRHVAGGGPIKPRSYTTAQSLRQRGRTPTRSFSRRSRR
jgi:propionyl-CoA synthetase